MVKNKIIIIPTHDAPDSICDYQIQTAKILAKCNIVIVILLYNRKSFKEIFGEHLRHKKRFRLLYKQDEIFYLSILDFIPFKRFQLARNINFHINILLLKSIVFLLQIINHSTPILWIFYPYVYELTLFFKNYPLIYDVVDYYTSYSPAQEVKMRKKEQSLIQKADLVVANSKVLKNYLTKYREDVFLVPQGFRLDHFIKIHKLESKVKGRKPLLGFVGGINDRLNYSLLSKLIKRNPQWDFVLWGPVQKASLSKKNENILKELFSLPNVTHGFFEDRKKLPSFINQFDIGIIPYDSSNKSNLNCYPMKIFEYFYLGKPVVTTTILELKRFPKYVKIGNTVNKWEELIKELLSKPWSFQEEQKTLAKENSWERKIDAISKIIDDENKS